MVGDLGLSADGKPRNTGRGRPGDIYGGSLTRAVKDVVAEPPPPTAICLSVERGFLHARLWKRRMEQN